MFSLTVDVISKASGQEYATSNKVLEESKLYLDLVTAWGGQDTCHLLCSEIN